MQKLFLIPKSVKMSGNKNMNINQIVKNFKRARGEYEEATNIINKLLSTLVNDANMVFVEVYDHMATNSLVVDVIDCLEFEFGVQYREYDNCDWFDFTTIDVDTIDGITVITIEDACEYVSIGCPTELLDSYISAVKSGSAPPTEELRNWVVNTINTRLAKYGGHQS